MEAELIKQTGADIELVASGGGVFEVAVDDKTIFSKRQLNRFPEDGEILRLMQNM